MDGVGPARPPAGRRGREEPGKGKKTKSLPSVSGFVSYGLRLRNPQGPITELGVSPPRLFFGTAVPLATRSMAGFITLSAPLATVRDMHTGNEVGLRTGE